ncbi:unnamed protein product [Caenorhabditis nigoni]
MAKPSVHRSSIIELYKDGEKPYKIANRLRIARSTVNRTIQRFEDTGTVKDRARQGRPVTVTTPQAVKVVRELIRRNAHRSIRKIAEDLEMSRFSMTNIVKSKLKQKSYRVTRAAILSEANKQKRLQKAKMLLAGTRDGEYLVTVFSDEKLFTVEAEFNPQNHRVLAHDIQDASDKGKTIHRTSHPASVMVFGAICSNGKCPLVSVDKGVKINKEYYVEEILEKHLLPWAQNHFSGQHWIFQQDGAPAHTAKFTQDWCERHLPEFIKKDGWPASSPDLNPLDFSIWGVLQKKLEYLRATVNAYPRRLRAVIQAGGGRIE